MIEIILHICFVLAAIAVTGILVTVFVGLVRMTYNGWHRV